MWQHFTVHQKMPHWKTKAIQMKVLKYDAQLVQEVMPEKSVKYWSMTRLRPTVHRLHDLAKTFHSLLCIEDQACSR